MQTETPPRRLLVFLGWVFIYPLLASLSWLIRTQRCDAEVAFAEA